MVRRLGAAGLALALAGGATAAGAAGVRPAARTAAKDRATVAVSFRFDLSAGTPIEGFVSYLSLRKPPADPVAVRVFRNRLEARRVTFSVPAGTYRLSAWQRTCDGNCGYLDPAILRCHRKVVLRAGHPQSFRVDVSFGPAGGCHIRAA